MPEYVQNLRATAYFAVALSSSYRAVAISHIYLGHGFFIFFLFSINNSQKEYSRDIFLN
jgi:hypothetical protein